MTTVGIIIGTSVGGGHVLAIRVVWMSVKIILTVSVIYYGWQNRALVVDTRSLLQRRRNTEKIKAEIETSLLVWVMEHKTDHVTKKIR